MTDYRKYINALRKCAKEHDNDTTYTGHIIISDLCRDTANLLEALEQESKTGHWEWVQYDANPEIGNFHCSECRYMPASFNMSAQKLNYCPNCGAKMESEV